MVNKKNCVGSNARRKIKVEGGKGSGSKIEKTGVWKVQRNGGRGVMI